MAPSSSKAVAKPDSPANFGALSAGAVLGTLLRGFGRRRDRVTPRVGVKWSDTLTERSISDAAQHTDHENPVHLRDHS